MPIELKRAAAVAVTRGHPWVYRDAVVRAPKNPSSGDVVDLCEAGARSFLARGLWDATSPIAVRVFTRNQNQSLEVPQLVERLERAVDRRKNWFDGGTNAYRLCNGEGDRVPGFVLDRYAEVAVVRLDTEALVPYLRPMVAGIEAQLTAIGVESVALRLEQPSANATKIETISGRACPEEIIVREHGVPMQVDLARGQKTGAFLDQRENRRRVRDLSKGRRVLNLFSYAGGFSLAAALGGATRVTSVDVSAAAHSAAQKSFRLNGIDPARHAFVSADVFAFLHDARRRGDHFDLVISDPPSFAPNERSKDRALASYRKLHTMALSVLGEGGMLCASSCSSHVNAEEFLATLEDTVIGGDLILRACYLQPEDHPTIPAWPEGRYLKFAILE